MIGGMTARPFGGSRNDQMREFFTNLSIFVVLVFAFSGLTSCGGQQSAGNSGTSKSGISGGPADPKAANYPALDQNLYEAELEHLDGTTFKASDKKGKVVLLNLWAIWCGPCRGEMPYLIELQNTYGSQGLEVIGLNVGDHDGRFEPVPNIKKFAEQMKLNYTLARIPVSLAAQFYKKTNQNYIPQTFILDRDGKLRGISVGGDPSKIQEIKATVAKIMAEG